MSSEKPNQEVLNPIHPSVLPRLDPAFIDVYNEHIGNTPTAPADVSVMRAAYSNYCAYAKTPAPEVGKIWDAKVPGHGDGAEIAVRVYEPQTTGPWPVHLNFHGGGWALGDLGTDAQILSHLCKRSSVAIIDVDYRLMPENPFPTGILDSFAALKFVHSQGKGKFNIDPSRISLGGSSAGGNIALVLAHLARDEGIPLKLVTVGVPVVYDWRKYDSPEHGPFPSAREMALAPTLNWEKLKKFDNLKWSSISNDPDIKEKQMEAVSWFADLLEAPNFDGLAKTVIYTAECDPLRDEGEAYTRKLVEAGNEVTVKRFKGVPHPFMHMDKGMA
ncbi:putative alpha beta hydrolase fold-3 protein [Neofusicoccum parvum UCRNP2]|uniref:Putative alpha beta hydrolase fold-3 protein n=1 Tax=Botryosphaeria parva (strain UCR-NP2) TaxID=1287680 RepID=R1GD91_BOTPV|nr:putative alpha beta hydrolase fold-3 protein [Neofusicoccum parvum UCRNP2]